MQLIRASIQCGEQAVILNKCDFPFHDIFAFFWAHPLNKCDLTLFDNLAFFGPKPTFLQVLSVFLIQNRPKFYPL